MKEGGVGKVGLELEGLLCVVIDDFQAKPLVQVRGATATTLYSKNYI